MNALDTSHYFSDPKVADFVDYVQRGDAERVRQQIAAGVDVNAEGIDGFRPIDFVFLSDSPDVLRLLLSAHADPESRLRNGNTPLYFAVRKPIVDFTQALLAAHADPNARGENNKPVIHEAIRFPQTGNIVLLANAGADINISWGGGTPLFQALMSMSWDAAAVLLDLGADVTLGDSPGERAVDLFCKDVDRVPANASNKPRISRLYESFRKRGVPVPCEGRMTRFR